ARAAGRNDLCRGDVFPRRPIAAAFAGKFQSRQPFNPGRSFHQQSAHAAGRRRHCSAEDRRGVVFAGACREDCDAVDQHTAAGSTEEPEIEFMTRTVLLLLAVGTAFAAFPLKAQVAADNYESLKAEAEKFYAERSYAKAGELYVRARQLANLSSNDTRWVAFRLADTQWRSQAGTQTSD